MANRRDPSRRWEGRGDRQDPDKGFRTRLVLVTFFFSLLGAAVIARAVYLQVVLHADLTERAVSQYRKSVYLNPSRGVIYDRRGRELAANVEAFSVYAEPVKVEDPKRAAARLAAELDLPADRLARSLEGRRGFVWLKRQVSPAEAKAVKGLDLPGIGLAAESRRFYPHRDLAAQLIGFAGIDSQGLEGIEFAYDRYLKGNAGWLVVQRDALDRPIFVEDYQSDPENRGQDLVLTIDQNIQYFAQEEIRRAVEAAGAKEGMAMVLDPKSGEILAMAVSGYFNPNNRESVGEGQWRNICLTHTYEPGSTMKPFIVAAALEEGTVDPDRVFYCGDGSFTMYGKTFKDVHPYGNLTVREILAKSSNVGAIKVGQTLPRERFHRWLTEFGFGRTTGIDLPGESRGLLRPPQNWSGLSQASLSIGMEVAVTPLQMVAAYGAIANDGLLHGPRVVRAVRREGREDKVMRTEGPRRVIKASTARLLREIMRQVVTDGTGRAAAIPGYTSAGKTGTAQKFSTSGGYASGKYLSSFIGYAPAFDPAVVILVMVDEPEGAYYGGSVAAPVFAKLGERILHYLAVPPDNQEQLQPVTAGTAGRGHAG